MTVSPGAYRSRSVVRSIFNSRPAVSNEALNEPIGNMAWPVNRTPWISRLGTSADVKRAWNLGVALMTASRKPRWAVKNR